MQLLEIEKFLEYCLQLVSHLLKSPDPVMSLEIWYFSDQGMKFSPPRRWGQLVLFNLVKRSLGGGYGGWMQEEEKMIKQCKISQTTETWVGNWKRWMVFTWKMKKLRNGKKLAGVMMETGQWRWLSLFFQFYFLLYIYRNLEIERTMQQYNNTASKSVRLI